jgi:hypothetical protein
MANGFIYTNTIVFDDQVMGGQHLEDTEALLEAWQIVHEVTGQTVLEQCSDLVIFPAIEKFSRGLYTTEEMVNELHGDGFLAVEGAISEILLDLDTVAFVDIAKATRLY